MRVSHYVLWNGHQQNILSIPFLFNSLNLCSSYWCASPVVDCIFQVDSSSSEMLCELIIEQDSDSLFKKCSNESNHSQKDQPQPATEIRTHQPEEPEKTLEDEFKDFHLNLSVLEVLAHAPMYNAILDKYVGSLELGKNGSAFIQGEMPKKIEDPGLFTLACRLGNSESFDTLADLGACVNIIPLYLFKKLNI
ncbi:hypothetical protein Tco_0169912 [Tanacetum coccineum]